MGIVPVVEMAEEPSSKFELSAFGGNDGKMLQRPSNIIRPSANAPYFPTPSSSSFVSTAEARIGRPLTPFSVAGVARRTVRRCAVGVYYC